MKLLLLLSTSVLLLFTPLVQASKNHHVRGGTLSRPRRSRGLKLKLGDNRHNDDHHVDKDYTHTPPEEEDRTGGDGVVFPAEGDCVTLYEPTAEALYQAIIHDTTEKLTLCDTTIKFERELVLPPVDHLHTIECVNECIFDGQHRHRILTLGDERLFPLTPWTPDNPPCSIPDITFRNIVFQKGVGIPTAIGDGGSGRQGGGGAIQATGLVDSIAFDHCTFRYNTATYSQNGGAIDVLAFNFGAKLKFKDCLFYENTAHTGGAINAGNICVELDGTNFEGNTCCGGGEGPAIYHSTIHGFEDMMHVECIGDDNQFVNNLDGVCLNGGPMLDAFPIVGCTENCGALGPPHCRL
jgi:hypothetical protein